MSFTAATYATARDAQWQDLSFTKASITTIAGRWFSMWTATGDPTAASIPGAVAACTSATAGALGYLTATEYMINSGGTARIVKIACQFGTKPNGGVLAINDRIAHIGGLSGITTGSITIGTTASSRYASGAASAGIQAAMEIYTAIGATATTMNMNSYTDQNGTAGNVGPLTTVGGTGFNTVGRLIHLPLVAPTTGVRSVENVTLTATTGTAGSYGITVFKPLVMLPIGFEVGPEPQDRDADGLGYFLPQVVSGACLWPTIMCGSTSTGIIMGKVSLGEE